MSTDYTLKFIIIGDTSVGKSCILIQSTERRFLLDHQPTIGVEFATRVITIGEQNLKLQIWDTAGLENFRALTKSYYRGASGALLVYDISDRTTFDNLPQWMEQLYENSSDNLVITLVGNKIDLETRQVSYQEGQLFARSHGMAFIETSAKTGQNIEEAFRQTAGAVCENIANNVYDLDGSAGGVRRTRTSEPSSGCGLGLQMGRPVCDVEERLNECCGRS